jgi:type IV pilus assembly protein PilB
MIAATKKSLIQILGEQGKISKDQAIDAMQRKQATTDSLEKILLEAGIAEADVYEAQAESMGVPFVDLNTVKVDAGARGILTEELQDRYGAVPLRLDGKKLTVAMRNPKDVFTLDEIRMKTGMDIVAVLAPPTQLQALRNGVSSNGNSTGSSNGNGNSNGTEALSPEAQDSASFDDSIGEMLDMIKPVEADATKAPKKTGQDNSLSEALSRDDNEVLETDISALANDGQLADEAPIIRIVNTILMHAIKDGASDIHIEPQRRGVRIRYRIDGVLHEQMKVPHYVLGPLISRVKIMAEMNIAERRIPQDGRIRITMQDKEYDMRVNSCPTTYGEKVVMRILDKSSVLIGLEKLGLYPETQAQLLDICNQPNGMFMICGPTGSGKTTTLYSVLNVINTIEKNLITVEDPVEYQLPGLSQVHVNRKAGLSFANALRAFLRQDPDVIMVGEIRDLETAEIAVQAALTGHLVLSTVHTNDAPSTATRLSDMGVEPFLISASLVGALAQRLARKICSNCKEEHVPARELLLRFGHDPLKHPETKFYRGRGCDKCRQSGYKGRLGIYELMRVNDELSEMIVRRAPLAELKEAARANGMHTLQEDGFRKCLDGLTTVDEVMRVVFTGGH